MVVVVVVYVVVLIFSKEMREVLKQQQELILPPYKRFVNSIAESRDVVQRVMHEEMIEREKRRQHHAYMTTFRDGNKVVRGLLNELHH